MSNISIFQLSFEKEDILPRFNEKEDNKDSRSFVYVPESLIVYRRVSIIVSTYHLEWYG